MPLLLQTSFQRIILDIVLDEDDASKTHVGAVLEQDGKLISCFSILVKEFHAIVFACQKFDYYIDGRSSTQVFTDHKAIEYMLEGKLNDKFCR